MVNWQKIIKPLLVKKYGEIYPGTRNKNNSFITYLIEKHKKYFIIYRVFWKNQGI